jgi:Transposase, Mutator family
VELRKSHPKLTEAPMTEEEWRFSSCSRAISCEPWRTRAANPDGGDVEGLIGARRHERSGDRLNYRDGCRDRTLDTRRGPLSCASPSCGRALPPPFLEPRKTAEKALVMVIQEAWIGGVSTRTSWCRRWASLDLESQDSPPIGAVGGWGYQG